MRAHVEGLFPLAADPRRGCGVREAVLAEDPRDYLFTGHRWDPETGLYYARNNELDPTTGRWIAHDRASDDPLGNLYGYCGGNPVNRVDPLGLRDQTDTDVAVIRGLWAQARAAGEAGDWDRAGELYKEADQYKAAVASAGDEEKIVWYENPSQKGSGGYVPQSLAQGGSLKSSDGSTPVLDSAIEVTRTVRNGAAAAAIVIGVAIAAPLVLPAASTVAGGLAATGTGLIAGGVAVNVAAGGLDHPQGAANGLVQGPGTPAIEAGEVFLVVGVVVEIVVVIVRIIPTPGAQGKPCPDVKPPPPTKPWGLEVPKYNMAEYARALGELKKWQDKLANELATETGNPAEARQQIEAWKKYLEAMRGGGAPSSN